MNKWYMAIKDRKDSFIRSSLIVPSFEQFKNLADLSGPFNAVAIMRQGRVSFFMNRENMAVFSRQISENLGPGSLESVMRLYNRLSEELLEKS